MKNFILLTFLIMFSSISFSQTINGCLVDFEQNANPFDSTLFVTLQIRLNQNESEVLGHAKRLKFDYSTAGLQFVEGTYVNFHEPDGYQTTTIYNPCGTGVIKNIETILLTGPGRVVTDEWINFIVFEFKIIDFSELAWVCPRDSAQWFYFHSPYTEDSGPDCEWTIGEWTCFEEYVPVELTSFTATQKFGNVVLNWTTATELNNLGFEIERKLGNSSWQKIGFVEGKGTTTEPGEYSYVDDVSGITAIAISYRLKQVDLDGSYEYSDAVEIDNITPSSFALYQNFPNPFNPVTTISYSLPEKDFITIKVYDVIGNEVATLVNDEKQSGNHRVEFNATDLKSGAYFYRIQAGNVVETKKMILIK